LAIRTFRRSVKTRHGDSAAQSARDGEFLLGIVTVTAWVIEIVAAGLMLPNGPPDPAVVAVMGSLFTFVAPTSAIGAVVTGHLSRRRMATAQLGLVGLALGYTSLALVCAFAVFMVVSILQAIRHT
jgi:hypothetical protein